MVHSILFFAAAREDHQRLQQCQVGSRVPTAANQDVRNRIPSLSLITLQVSPTFLDLQPGAHGQLSIQFTPSELGKAQEGFVMACDNCQAKSFTVTGTGTDVDVQVTSIDGEDVEPGQLKSPLWFGQVQALLECCCFQCMRDSSAAACTRYHCMWLQDVG